MFSVISAFCCETFWLHMVNVLAFSLSLFINHILFVHAFPHHYRSEKWNIRNEKLNIIKYKSYVSLLWCFCDAVAFLFKLESPSPLSLQLYSKEKSVYYLKCLLLCSTHQIAMFDCQITNFAWIRSNWNC